MQASSAPLGTARGGAPVGLVAHTSTRGSPYAHTPRGAGGNLTGGTWTVTGTRRAPTTGSPLRGPGAAARASATSKSAGSRVGEAAGGSASVSVPAPCVPPYGAAEPPRAR